MIKKYAAIVVLTLLNICWLNAQKLTIENVRKISLLNTNAIKEGSEVKGYYFFYINDKVNENTNEYILQITDNNLNKLKDIKFQDSKNVSVLESSFNGKDLIFLLYNGVEKKIEYQVYGADGNKKHSYLRELTNTEISYLNVYYSMSDEEQDIKGVYPVESIGFISNMPKITGKENTFQLDFLSTEKNYQWTYSPIDGKKKFTCDYLGYNNGVVYLAVLKFKSMFTANADAYITGLSLETGKILFEIPAEQEDYQFFPTNLINLQDGKIYLFGEYFDKNDNVLKDNSRGFAFWRIDEKGVITNKKYLGWKNELSKYLDVNSKGEINDFGYLYLHSIVETATGELYAVGEGFKKSSSAAGIGLKVLTARMPVANKVIVSDLLLLGFDRDLNIKSATKYPKKSNTIKIGPLGIARTRSLGIAVKHTFGGFDYMYTQSSPDKSAFTVYYRDYLKDKDYKGGTFNSISYSEGKFSTDKVNTKSDATTTTILPNRQGQVLMIDYFQKEKRLDIHLEKMN